MNSLLLGSLRAALAAVIFTLSGNAYAEEGWLVSFEKAKQQAAKEGKPILMEFTGSDWCPPCKALHKNVLVKDDFKNEMPKHFVLLKLDNPRDKSKQTPEEIEQYKELSQEKETCVALKVSQFLVLLLIGKTFLCSLAIA